MYLEAVAILPQIYMFQRQAADEGGTVEVSSIYYDIMFEIDHVLLVYGSHYWDTPCSLWVHLVFLN